MVRTKPILSSFLPRRCLLCAFSFSPSAAYTPTSSSCLVAYHQRRRDEDPSKTISNNTQHAKIPCNLVDATNEVVLLDRMPQRATLVQEEQQAPLSWTNSMTSLIRCNRADLALSEFCNLHRSGVRPNESDFSLALKACRIGGELSVGRLLHGCALKSGFESYAFCATSLLNMYINCGKGLDDARKLFNQTSARCEALWNALMDGYVMNSDTDKASALFHHMLLSGASPSSYTYTILLKLCNIEDDTHLLRFFHARVIKAGFDKYAFIGGSLVSIYAKLGDLSDASKVFWSLEEHDHVVWSALLAGFHHSGDAEQGVTIFRRFISAGNKLDPFTYASMFIICSRLETPYLGLQIHSCLGKSGFVLDSVIGCALVDMYASFGMTADAYRSFLDTSDRNGLIYGATVRSFVKSAEYKSAQDLFFQMRKLGLMPDSSTINCVLEAYTDLYMLEGGRMVHGLIVKTIGEGHLVTGNTLVESYAECMSPDEALQVFNIMVEHNEFSWTALISGYFESERYQDSLKLFHAMLCSASAKPSQFTLVAVLQSCSELMALKEGKQTHGYIIKLGFRAHSFVESALIGMYAKCCQLDDAYGLFSNESEENVVSLSILISAYSRQGHAEKSLKLFKAFQGKFISIDRPILCSCLSSCACLVAPKTGKCLHCTIIKIGFESDLHVGSSLIDMYCKCGSIGDAYRFFDMSSKQNVVSWTAMICGYAQHGLGRQALYLFDEMINSGVEPDAITFIGVFSACSHVGLMKEGQKFFKSMIEDYGLDVTVDHYACMVDLLGRLGHVTEAEELINMSPFPSESVLWKTLLGACNKHGHIDAGNRIAEILIKLEPSEPSTYVLLSNIYAAGSLWDLSSKVKNKLKEGNMKKKPGCSWIELAEEI